MAGGGNDQAPHFEEVLRDSASGPRVAYPASPQAESRVPVHEARGGLRQPVLSQRHQDAYDHKVISL